MRFPLFSNILHYFTKQNIAITILIVMLIQFVFIEGYAISPLKVGLMALMPLIFIIKVPYVSKALIFGIIYIVTILCSSSFHSGSFRFSTIGYLGMFVFTFITLYNLIYNRAFSLPFFIRFLKLMIWAYGICLFCQQLFILAGIRFIPFINLNDQSFLAIDKLPSLSIEPSHSARILGVLMYAYMECISYRQGSSFCFRQLLEQEHKWVTACFLWSMLTMGSGTAFIVLGVLSLYFINWRNALLVVPLIVFMVYIGSQMGIKQFDRAYNTAQATLTLDKEEVQDTDRSASARITPLLNTIKNLDLTKKEHWFGYGVDAGIGNKSERMMAEITDYGFLAYICGLILVFSCSIRFWSIPTIMYFIGIGGGTGNIAYQWGILMVFMCVRYFYNNREYQVGLKYE